MAGSYAPGDNMVIAVGGKGNRVYENYDDDEYESRNSGSKLSVFVNNRDMIDEDRDEDEVVNRQTGAKISNSRITSNFQ